MTTEKRCPSCGAEYRTDIEKCFDCNVFLIEATSEMLDDLKGFPDDADLIAVAIGSVKNIQSVVDLLEANKIKFRVDLTNQLSERPHPDSDFQLMIEEKDVPLFNQLVEEFKYRQFPELAAAAELMEAGCCPACGAKVGDKPVCSECDLPLVIIEETEEDQER